jgi:hypothetical protein
MSAANVRSGIAVGVTLTPPVPGPATARIVDWYVPAGTTGSAAVEDDPQAGERSAAAMIVAASVDFMSPPDAIRVRRTVEWEPLPEPWRASGMNLNRL